jgi:2-polyprenyl-6-hydroxyphenyl methylase / 3-demethylubiquinone-9 3-methyltransferase
MKTTEELKILHGKNYVEIFEKEQSPFRLKRLLDSINLDKSNKVIDFACGNGMLMPLIAYRVAQYTGVDFSEEFIKSAQNKMQSLSIDNAQFVCSDIIDFCSKNNGIFDVAFAMDFSEHVYDSDWLNILCSIKKSLKPEGKLYLHTPNADFFLEKMKANNFIVKQFPEHIAVRSPSENKIILEKAGFHVTDMKLIPHYNVLRFLHPLSLFPLIGKYFKARIFIEAT